MTSTDHELVVHARCKCFSISVNGGHFLGSHRVSDPLGNGLGTMCGSWAARVAGVPQASDLGEGELSVQWTQSWHLPVFLSDQC